MGLLLLFETSTCCAGQTSAANAPELRDELISRVERDQEYIDSMEVEVKQFLSEVLDLFNQLKARQK